MDNGSVLFNYTSFYYFAASKSSCSSSSPVNCLTCVVIMYESDNIYNLMTMITNMRYWIVACTSLSTNIKRL